MAAIKVHGDIGQVELSDSVVGALEVGGLRTGALCNVEVGDQVCQGIGLCIEKSGNIVIDEWETR